MAAAHSAVQPLYWTYDDLATRFGHSADWVKARMADFAARGFPQPVPWSRRQKRWSPQAVEAWIIREERRAGALGAPDLKLIEGGLAHV